MNFELQVSSRWSSTRPEARKQIRKAILRRTQDEAVLTPTNYHKGGDAYFSISHTRGLGGYVLGPVPTGFDIELQNREISERAVRRLTTLKERELGFSAIEIWVAKEAAFKASTACQDLKTVTQITLKGRQQKNSKAAIEFSFKTNKINSLSSLGRGFLVRHGRFLLGFACILP
jgi:hypothetical protein